MSSWPWFPFYVDDFLASPKVQKMDLAEIGTYVLLLCEQWQVGHVDPGNLPRSLRRQPQRVSKILKECFEPTTVGWVNLRLAALREGQDVKRDKAKAAAMARWKDADASAKHMRTHRPSNAIQSQSQSHTPPSVEASERKAKRKTALPTDWRPNEGHHSQAKRDGLNAESEAEQFRDHHTAKGSVMLDWDAAFRTWLRNAKKFADRDANRGGQKADEGAAQAMLVRGAEGWTERRRATEEAIARKLAERTPQPPTANEPSGPLGATLARVLEAVQPVEKAS